MSFSELLTSYGDLYVQAFLNTWSMTLVSFACCMLLALAVTVMRVSPVRPLRMAGDLYVQIFRNIPGISLLVILGTFCVSGGMAEIMGRIFGM